MAQPPPSRRRVLFLNWRDTQHPEGGGSERYVEEVAQGLVAQGDDVEIFCAAHPNAPADETVNGVRFRRRGNRLTIYLRAMWHVLRSRADVVIDTQNGVPYFSVLVARCPVIVLVHHVHREQWPVAVPAPVAKLGWWIESWLAPRLYRRCQYVAVSGITRDELIDLGVAADRIAVVPNGTYPPPRVTSERSPTPRLVAVGRLVPHKRLEHAIDVVAELRHRWPEVRLDIVGHGWWRSQILEYAQRRGVADRVRLHGYVDEQTKHELLAQAWVHLVPSLKEGWGIVVMEAAVHGVPTIAYANAGGVAESIVAGRTGQLAAHRQHFIDQVAELLADDAARTAMGEAAQERALTFGWANSLKAFSTLLPR